MKVLLLNGSPKSDGNTYTALSEVRKELSRQGIETEIVQIGKSTIRGCIDCGKCAETKKCIFNDDMVNILIEKIRSADGLIVGTPVYYSSPNGSLVSLLDRVFYAGSGFEYKPAASIAIARRAGTTSSLEVINKYFTIKNMPVISSQYWNVAFGTDKGEALQDKEGMQIMRTLGKNMAWALKLIENGRKNGIFPPEAEKQEITNFIR